MAFSSKYKRNLRARLVKAQEGRCCYCRRPFADDGPTKPTIEHKKAKMDGGKDRVANLAAACLHCNALRGKQMNQARLRSRRIADSPATDPT